MVAENRRILSERIVHRWPVRKWEEHSSTRHLNYTSLFNESKSQRKCRIASVQNKSCKASFA